MRDRRSTGRITEERKVFKRSRPETDPQSVPDVPQAPPELEKPEAQAGERTVSRGQIADALRALDLPDYHVSEVTAADVFEVDGRTVVQLKNGEFVKIAMIAPGQENPDADG